MSPAEKATVAQMRVRIDGALDIAMQYSNMRASHHRAWVIDQMVRALTGCPLRKEEAQGESGRTYTWYNFGESEEYRHFVELARHGEDGSVNYDWDTGTTP